MSNTDNNIQISQHGLTVKVERVKSDDDCETLIHESTKKEYQLGSASDQFCIFNIEDDGIYTYKLTKKDGSELLSKFFSSCKIHDCLHALQYKSIIDKDRCTKNSPTIIKRDFLLSAVHVIDYLKETNNLDEAQRILDNLSECGYLCSDKVTVINDCNCGDSI